MRTAAATTLNCGKKALACSLAYLMIPLGMGDLYAQSAPPPPPDQGQYQDQAPPPPDQQQYGDQDQGPPPQAYNALSPDQLNQMVAPIALYPDSLVAQILAASTYPSQIADADHFVQANAGAPPDQIGQMVDGMNWDPSVKALVAFPTVLANLDKNMDWTSQLGNAYYNQPQDVMAAVQTMRQRAYAAGNLQSNQQLAVTYAPGNIVIAPANPTVVYVPYYNPWVVYGAPVVAYPAYYVAPAPRGYVFAAGLAIGFGVGIAVASWNHWGWGWHNWGMGWGSRTVVYQRNVYVSRSVTVVNHGYYGHYDRNPEARAYNRNMAARAPNYHNANYNHTTINNYNRTNNNYHPAPNSNYNHPNNNVRPAYNNQYHPTPNNSYNHTNTNTNYNHPENNTRPATPNSYNHPENNSRPATPNNYNHPENNSRPANNPRPEQNYNRPQPQSHPQTQSHPQSHPESKPESHPSGKSNDKDKAHR